MHNNQGVRKNVICYIGWYNLGININEKLKIFFSNFNEKLKGVVKKDKKIEYSKYKNPSCEAIFVIIFNAMRKKTQSQSTWLMNTKFSYMYVSLYYAYSHLSVSIWLISCHIYLAQRIYYYTYTKNMEVLSCIFNCITTYRVQFRMRLWVLFKKGRQTKQIKVGVF